MGCGGQKEEKVVSDEHDECGKKEKKDRKNAALTDPDDGKYVRIPQNACSSTHLLCSCGHQERTSRPTSTSTIWMARGP